ncbi:MAG: hypothetical protein ACHQ1E_15055, partial [Ktedonobacterales bacterium]
MSTVDHAAESEQRERQDALQRAADTPAMGTPAVRPAESDTGAAKTRQSERQASAPTRLPRPRGNLRWTIAVLLFVGIVINYFDRVN